MQFNEDHLATLLACIRGEGEWAFSGPCLTSFPAAEGTLHEHCLELERRGQIRRRRDQPESPNVHAYIIWEPIPRGRG